MNPWLWSIYHREKKIVFQQGHHVSIIFRLCPIIFPPFPRHFSIPPPTTLRQDTEATRAELAAIFGSKVADLVHRLTDEEGEGFLNVG